MISWEQVSVDPFPRGLVTSPVCFACGTSRDRSPALPYTLRPSQIIYRASVDTGDHPNPFADLDATKSQTVLLCSDCKHIRTGWQVIANQRKYGSESQKALKLWKTLCQGGSTHGTRRQCSVCASLQRECESGRNMKFSRSRNPSKDWKLFSVLATGNDEVKEKFVTEFGRLASCDTSTASMLLQDPDSTFFCSYHMNHSRYAREYSMRHFQHLSGNVASFCFLKGSGCMKKNSALEGRLWRVPFVDSNIPEYFETFSELEDAVSYHSGGTFHALQVMGQYDCRPCLYIVTEGKEGLRSLASLQSLGSSVDKFLLRCVLFALTPEKSVADSALLHPDLSAQRRAIVKRFHGSCFSPTVLDGEDIRLLPFMEVFRCRCSLLCDGDFNDVKEGHLTARTFEKKIESVIAGEGIILRRLSYRTRCYMRADQVDKILLHVANTAQNPQGLSQCPTVRETRTHLDAVAARFVSRKEFYWNGKWSLTEEVAEIPSPLWADVILQMFSQKSLVAWNAVARIQNQRLADVFPVSNARTVLPQKTMEEELRGSIVYSRGDLLLCVRALKVIDQLVLSETNSAAGPLTVSPSVCGICEVSPSFVRVLNSMGLFFSYNVTERYQQRLIAEREKNRPWDFGCIDDSSVPVLQFDNWDIRPLHSVKVDGKALPKVNGSLLQGQLSGSKRRNLDANFGTHSHVSVRGWKNPGSLGTRELFIDKLTCTENEVVLQQFNSIVMGMVCLCGAQLVGGKDFPGSEYNAGTTQELRYRAGPPRKLQDFTSIMLQAAWWKTSR